MSKKIVQRIKHLSEKSFCVFRARKGKIQFTGQLGTYFFLQTPNQILYYCMFNIKSFIQGVPQNTHHFVSYNFLASLPATIRSKDIFTMPSPFSYRKRPSFYAILSKDVAKQVTQRPN